MTEYESLLQAAREAVRTSSPLQVVVSDADRKRLSEEKQAWLDAGFSEVDLMPVPRQLDQGRIYWEVRPKIEAQ